MAEQGYRETFDNTCRYARQVNGHWEYGVLSTELLHPNAAPTHVKGGEAPTLEEALLNNGMATSSVTPAPYEGYPCFGKY